MINRWTSAQRRPVYEYDERDIIREVIREAIRNGSSKLIARIHYGEDLLYFRISDEGSVTCKSIMEIDERIKSAERVDLCIVPENAVIDASHKSISDGEITQLGRIWNMGLDDDDEWSEELAFYHAYKTKVSARTKA